MLPGAWTPRVQEAAVRLGAWIPSFAQAATLLAAFLHTTVSAATARRQTAAAGAAYVTVQTAAVATLEAARPATPPPGPAVLSLRADGAMVPLVGKGQWAEVKTLALGVVRPAVWEQEKLVVHTTRLVLFLALDGCRDLYPAGAGGNAAAGRAGGRDGGGGHRRGALAAGVDRLSPS